ncbi:MAG: hypothetical protein P8X42_19600 [Calditrichaceae bacterium]|jgi:hypothetical protein
MKENKLINSLSPHLFWEVYTASIDTEKHLKYIISRVLIYGLYSDWQAIVKYYGLDNIVKTAINMRELNKKTASFLSVLSGVPKTRFKCYIIEESLPKHWNF